MGDLKRILIDQREMASMALPVTRQETVADSNSSKFLRSKTSDSPCLKNREEGDRLDRLGLLWEFLAILPVLRGITTSTFLTMTALQGRNQELLMESVAATALSHPRGRM